MPHAFHRLITNIQKLDASELKSDWQLMGSALLSAKTQIPKDYLNALKMSLKSSAQKA